MRWKWKLRERLIRALTDRAVQERETSEAGIRAEANALARKRLWGGIYGAYFNTPEPWRCEADPLRKLAWRICALLGRSSRRSPRPVYALPIKTDEYKQGRTVIFHSGVVIREKKDGEYYTFAQAIFDPIGD